MEDYKFENIPCNICGSNYSETISNKGKFNLPLTVVLCKNCGLGYLNPRWDSMSYLKFYENEYDRYYRPSIDKNSPSKKNGKNPIIERLSKQSISLKKTSHILDIGSGEGLNLLAFKSHLPNSVLFAIEPSRSSQKILKANNIEVISHDIDTDWESKYIGKFDLIIMRHVLEHFLNPKDALKKVRSVLSDSGIAYIAVPNNLNPTHNLKESWFRNVHTYYFNKYSLNNLMNITGFKILKLVEGDMHNKGEVYLVVKPSIPSTSVSFSKDHFQEQLAVYKNRLIQDNSIILKLSSFIRKIISKRLSSAR